MLFRVCFDQGLVLSFDLLFMDLAGRFRVCCSIWFLVVCEFFMVFGFRGLELGLFMDLAGRFRMCFFIRFLVVFELFMLFSFRGLN